MSADFEVRGLNPLLAALRNLERRDATRALRTGVRKAANHVRKHARAGAPVLTGNYKKSLRVKSLRLRGGEVAAVKIGPQGKSGAHGHLIELGTGDRIQKTTGRSTGRMPRMRHLQIVHQRVEPELDAIFRREVQAAIAKVK
jgi:HK97 gp10 family phage protein